MQNKLIGTTKIELTNVKTGEVEKYENHNMLTNAISDIFKPLGLSNKPYRYFNDFVPYYEKLLGGILCFDTVIEENPNNYYPPVNANIVGCAAYGMQNNTQNTFRGGFNQTESEVNLNDRYVKYVYDFATSQANGTIESICLTNKNGGLTSYGGKNTAYISDYPLMQSICEDTLQYVRPEYTGAPTGSKCSSIIVDTTEVIFLIDRNEDCIYYFKIIDDRHINIIKRRAFLKSVSILEDVRYKKPLIEEINLSELGVQISYNDIGYNYDPSKDCLYIYTCNTVGLGPNQTVLVTEIKIDSWEIKQYQVTNTTNVKLSTDRWDLFVTEGYLLIKTYNSPYELYKINIENPADVVKFKRTNVDNIKSSAKCVINGRVYYEYTNAQLLIANILTNEIMPPEAKSLFGNYRDFNATPVRNEPLLYFADFGNEDVDGCWNMMCNYLATINNLDVPITKTADKTMKITYILQEE